MSFLSNVSDAVNKRICRFLIHRYLGDLLKEKVRLDQLSVNLYQGTGTINGLSIDSKFVNECFEQAKIPIRLVDGYIGEVTVHIPWGKLLEDSCHFEIRGLEITLQPRPDHHQSTAPDIMASMLESMVGSLASSVELARSFLNEDGEGEDSVDTGEGAEDGVEAFAQMINAVLARMRISFFDSIVRVEHFPNTSATKATHGIGLEIRISEVDFMDEQLETCKKMGDTAEPITTQPHSLYTVPDLNKILHLKGVELYTDLFSDPERCPQTLYAQMDRDPLDSAGGILTSMYLRRQQGSMLSSRLRDVSSTESDSPLSATSSVFQSCLSTVPEPLADDLGLSGEFSSSSAFLPSPSEPSKPSSDAWTFSNPIKFAEFSGDKQLVHFKLRNPDPTSDNDSGVSRRFDLEMFLGSANIFLSPSQLKILETILEAIFSPEDSSQKRLKNKKKKAVEKEMKPEDFAQVEQQLQNGLNADELWKTGLETGNWSGEEKFYSTFAKPKKPAKTATQSSDNDQENFTSIIMNDPSSMQAQETLDVLRIEDSDPFVKKASLSPRVKERPEITYFKAKMGSVWCVLTHQDPFTSQKSTEEANSLLQDWAAGFFKIASQLQIAVHSFSLKESRDRYDTAFPRDHLRLLGCPVSFSTTIERTSTSEDIRLSLTAATCELLECLTPDSVIFEKQAEKTETGMLHKLNILQFSKSREEDLDGEEMWREEPDLDIAFQSDDVNPMKLTIGLAPCLTELDLSIVDRLNSLLDAQPPFLPSPSQLSPNGRNNPASLFQLQSFPPVNQNGNMELRDDLFQPFDSTASEKPGGVPILSTKLKENMGLLEDLSLSSIGLPKSEQDESSQGLELSIRCPSWTIDLQIPVADLRESTAPSGRTPWWVKRLRSESLRLELQNAFLRCPQLSPAASKKGQIQLNATQALGSLLEPQCAPIPFLKASSNDEERCSIRVQWDMRNRSLSMESERGRGSKSEEDSGSWGSCFQLPKTKEGPFSRQHVIHEDQELTLVGGNEEMESFGSGSRAHTELDIALNLPRLNVHLPNKQFFERLYNRVVNDLAMWEPSAPSSSTPQLPTTSSSQYYSIHVAGIPDNDRFILCKSAVQHYDSDGDSEDETGTERQNEAHKRPTAHRICCSLRSNETRALLVTPVEGKVNEESEISLRCEKGDFFLVSGYHGDPNIAFMYFKTGKLWLQHQNESPYFLHDVSGDKFGESVVQNETQLCAEPTPVDLRASCNSNDNLALGMRLQLKPDSNSKEILVTVGVRNTTLHFHPMSNTADWWIMQLVEFFNVIDYPIEGYEMPQVLTELHTHVWSSAISYQHREHSVLSPGEDGSWVNSEMRVWIENADISSYIMQEAKILRFRCLFEDSKIYLREQTSPSPAWAASLDEFVSILKTGFFELEVLVADDMLNQAREEGGPRRPSLEVKVRNDLVKVWTCADAVAAMSRIAQHIVKESTEPSISAKSSATATMDDSSTTIGSTAPQSYDPSGRLQQKSELTLSDEEDLKSLVTSAMKEEQSPPINIAARRNEESVEDSLPPSYSSDEVKFDLEDAMADMAMTKPTCAAEPRSRAKSGTDDEYCIVDEITGSGIRAASGEPRVRLLDGEKLQIADNHFTAPLTRRDPVTSLPSGFPQPMMRYLIRDFSLLLNLYGGSDFGMCKENRPYSESASQTVVGGRRLKKAPIPPRGSDERGGIYRDHSVSVQFLLSKICCIYELFEPGAPAVSRQVVTIDDIEIRDRLAVSQINKILYQYSSEKKPRQTQTPMVSVRLLETKPGEAKLKVGLLPIRLNLDQDTLEFLQDFGSEINQSFHSGPENRKSEPPVLEIPVRNPSRPSSLINSTSSEPHESPTQSPVKSFEPVLTDSVLTIGGFLEDDSCKPFQNDASAEDSSRVSLSFEAASQSSTFPSVRFQTSPSSEIGGDLSNSQSSSGTNPFDGVGTDLKRALETPPSPSNALYFNEFTFAPALTVKLDYHGKRRFEVGGQGRSIEGLLLGLSQLHCTELRMKELHCRQGLLGIERVLLHAQREWLGDIIKNQLPQVVGSVGPISSLTQVAQGVRDLFWLPVAEYKKDGHFVKGMQKGAESFGVSTASATVELTQLLVGFLQGAAEFAFEITAPEYPPPRKAMDPYKALRRPADFRDGLGRAYDEFRVGVAEAAEVVQLAMQDEVAKGRWGGRGVLRQATPLFFRPILVSSKATAHILGGLKSQLRPESRKEEQDKWRLTQD